MSEPVAEKWMEPKMGVCGWNQGDVTVQGKRRKCDVRAGWLGRD